ncbi:hypothetical protein ASF04_20135 [Duganella sp. Leaf61]|uniref:hypothetical protein n=1 Tax=Duganella sp. Leaf61 TaxID=1736227 RepID=UPI0006FE2D7C|nr:hypothetical protein [Duganella sp. Leaf61]KQN65219.1 hypothetical protein ASF04_20135 [Duganella sp. Leaf61]
MSTWNQAILARAVLAPDQAKQLADKVIAWLADEGIILDAPSNCDFDDSLCYPPGPDFLKVHNLEDLGPDPTRFADSYRVGMRDMRLVLGRGPVFNAQGRFLSAHCPSCQQPVQVDDLLRSGESWISGECDVMQCPHCEVDCELPLWEHDDIAFVMLAFEFWDWAVLSERFVASVGDKLGVKVTLLTGKH